MYELEQNVDLSFFEGQMLIQISIGQHQVLFRFENNATLSCEVDIEHRFSDGKIFVFNDFWRQETHLNKLLGSSVKKVKIESPKRLSFDFSNNHTISIEDDSDMYESFQMWYKDKYIVV